MESIIKPFKQYYANYKTIDNNESITSLSKDTAPLVDNSEAILYYQDDTESVPVTDSINTDDYNYNQYPIDKIQNLDEKLKWIVSDDYRFPLCNLDELGVMISSSKTDSVGKEMSKFRRWFIIINLLIANAIHFGMEACIASWYTVYLEDKFNSNILISTCQLSLLALCFIFGMQCMTIIGEKLKSDQIGLDPSLSIMHVTLKYDYRNFFVVSLAICYIMLIGITALLYPNTNNFKITFWIFAAMSGLFYGLSSNAQQIILLEVMPKDITGKISGWKDCIMLIMRGVIILIVGLLWDISKEWFWYTQAIGYTIELGLLVVLVVAEMYVNF